MTNKKAFLTSFIITSIILIVFFAMILVDYRCRKNITGDMTLPFTFEEIENSLYLNIYTFGIDESIEIGFLTNIIDFCKAKFNLN